MTVKKKKLAKLLYSFSSYEVESLFFQAWGHLLLITVKVKMNLVWKEAADLLC